MSTLDSMVKPSDKLALDKTASDGQATDGKKPEPAVKGAVSTQPAQVDQAAGLELKPLAADSLREVIEEDIRYTRERRRLCTT